MTTDQAITDVLATNGRADRLGAKQLNYLIDAVVRRVGHEVPDISGMIRTEVTRRRNV